MQFFFKGSLVLFVVVMLTACAAPAENTKAKVHCPACNTDFDALYHTRF